LKNKKHKKAFYNYGNNNMHYCVVLHDFTKVLTMFHCTSMPTVYSANEYRTVCTLYLNWFGKLVNFRDFYITLIAGRMLV